MLTALMATISGTCIKLDNLTTGCVCVQFLFVCFLVYVHYVVEVMAIV